MNYQTSTEQQTINLGKKIAQEFQGGEIILLQGDLGSGKTVLVKGIAKGLGIKKVITSPTFVLFKVYPVKSHKIIKQFVHVDAYRLDDGKELLTAGLGDYLGVKNTVVAVEWGEKIKPEVDFNYIEINFKFKNSKRIINIKLT